MKRGVISPEEFNIGVPEVLYDVFRTVMKHRSLKSGNTMMIRKAEVLKLMKEMKCCLPLDVYWKDMKKEFIDAGWSSVRLGPKQNLTFSFTHYVPANSLYIFTK